MRLSGAKVDHLTIDSRPTVPPERIATLEAESIEPLGDKEVVYTMMTNLLNPGEATDSPANTVIIKDVHLGSDDLTVFIGVTIRNT